MAKEKRKGLMAVLSEYQTEKGYGAKTKGKGPVKSGKEYGKTLKQNKKEDASGPKVLAPKKRNPPKTTNGGSSRSSSSSSSSSSGGSSSSSSGGGGKPNQQSGPNKNPFRNSTGPSLRVGQVRDGKKWNGKRWVPVTSSSSGPNAGSKRRTGRRGTGTNK